MTYKPSKIENLPSFNIRPGSKRIRVWIGPLELKPAGAKRAATPGKMDPNSDQFMGLVSGLPGGVLVLSTNSSLKYGDGTVADVVNGVYNHHLIFADLAKAGKSPISCASGSGSTMPSMGLLMGASEANRDLQFAAAGSDFKSGFTLGKYDPIMMNGEIVNYSNQTKQIYTVSDIEYLETIPAGSLDSAMHVFNIDQCVTGKAAGMPANQAKWSMQSGKAALNQDGFILFRRGHMHGKIHSDAIASPSC